MKTVFINGSPKSKLSVSSYLLGIVRLFVRGEVIREHVRNAGDHGRILNSIADADAVVFGLPLYVDGVPSHMLAFMKEMEKFCINNKIHLQVYVVSNGGFIEGCQSRPLMMVFENFCKRCQLQWAGGIGIGGGVMLNVMRVLFFVALGQFLLFALSWGVTAAFSILLKQLSIILFFCLGVNVYCMRMGVAVNKNVSCGVKFTRILLPSFIFILIADIFFVIISVFQGGIFKGWLKQR